MESVYQQAEAAAAALKRITEVQENETRSQSLIQNTSALSNLNASIDQLTNSLVRQNFVSGSGNNEAVAQSAGRFSAPQLQEIQQTLAGYGGSLGDLGNQESVSDLINRITNSEDLGRSGGLFSRSQRTGAGTAVDFLQGVQREVPEPFVPSGRGGESGPALTARLAAAGIPLTNPAPPTRPASLGNPQAGLPAEASTLGTFDGYGSGYLNGENWSTIWNVARTVLGGTEHARIRNQQNRANGGIIYANNGFFQPQGTDTVPAMLTPGEMVVNAESTAANRDLLERINKARAPLKVQYRPVGGLVFEERDNRQRNSNYLEVGGTNPVLVNGATSGSYRLNVQDDLAGKNPFENYGTSPVYKAGGGQVGRAFKSRIRDIDRPGFNPFDPENSRHAGSADEIGFDILSRNPSSNAFFTEALLNGSSLGNTAAAFQGSQQRSAYYERLLGSNRTGGQAASIQRQSASIFEARAIESRQDLFRRPRFGNPNQNVFDALQPGGGGGGSSRTRGRFVSRASGPGGGYGPIDEARVPRGEFGETAEDRDIRRRIELGLSQGTASIDRSGEDAFGRDSRRREELGLGARAEGSPFFEAPADRDARRRGELGLGSIPTSTDRSEETAYERFLRRREELGLPAAFRPIPYAPRGYENGGFVSGPSGGDVIPAYLSNGEYVLDRNTTAMFGQRNLANAQRFANGGLVGASGNANGAGLGIGDTNELQQALLNFSAENSKLTEALTAFGRNSSELTEALNNFPKTLEISGSQTVEVLINGAEVLAGIEPGLKELVDSSIELALNNMIKTRFPDNL